MKEEVTNKEIMEEIFDKKQIRRTLMALIIGLLLFFSGLATMVYDIGIAYSSEGKYPRTSFPVTLIGIAMFVVGFMISAFILIGGSAICWGYRQLGGDEIIREKRKRS